MSGQSRSASVRVGVVGTGDSLRRIIDVAEKMASPDVPAISLVGVTYTRPSQIAAKVRSFRGDVDAILFAGPLSHDIAIAAEPLPCPATHVELSGSALYGALLRAQAQGMDVRKVSVDSLSTQAVAEAYDESGLTSRAVRIAPYSGPESAARFADFHTELFREGHTCGALTTVARVESDLTKAGVPVVRLRATDLALRASLKAAAFLGAGTRLESSVVVVGLVELPDLSRQSAPEVSARRPWATHELRLEVVRALRAEVDAAAMTLLPRDDRTLVLIATYASLSAATGNFVRAPFVRAVREATGVEPVIAFGMGTDALQAERAADDALLEARSRKSGDRTIVRTLDGSTLNLRGVADGKQPEPATSKHLAAFHELLSGAQHSEGSVAIVDAERAAAILDVSARTARRTLQELARAGLAWPVPPAGGGAAPGRPRQTYRLVGPAA